eukprot:6200517-Pleurochrysis_carterae.AAC.1
MCLAASLHGIARARAWRRSPTKRLSMSVAAPLDAYAPERLSCLHACSGIDNDCGCALRLVLYVGEHGCLARGQS